MKPNIEQQIAWVQSLHDDHVLKVQRNGDLPGEGTAMIAAVLESLKALVSTRPEEQPSTEDMVPLDTISVCPSCDGDGKLTTTPGKFGPCWRCHGHGRVMAYSESEEKFRERMKKVEAFVAAVSPRREQG